MTEQTIQQLVSENPLAEIDALVAARGEAQASVKAPHPRMQFNTATGEFTADGEVIDSPIADTNADIAGEYANAVATYERLAASRDEVTGYTATGAPIYKLSEAERANITKRATQMHASLEYQALRGQQILEARAAQQAAAERKQREDYAKAAWAGGSRERMSELQAAINRAEADEIARKIVANRTGRL